MSRGVKTGIIGTVFGGMLGVAGFGAYNIYSSLDGVGGGGSGGGTRTSSAPVSTEPPGAEDITRTADSFLTAWSNGDLAGAAKLTDSVQTATAALAAYRDQGHVTSVRARPGTVSASAPQVMPFTVEATVALEGITSPWSYGSSLTVVRGAAGKPVVRWAPAVVHPDLAAGDMIVTGRAREPRTDIVDRDGKVMDVADYPSLTRIFADFRTRYAPSLKGGVPGIETYVAKADGSVGKTLDVLKKGRAARLRTTLDADLQAAAERAVRKEDSAGVTALDTGTGGILAVAYNPPSGIDNALLENSAPGSTFKVVTAAALLQRGMGPSSAAECVNNANYDQGRLYRNDGGMNNRDATLDWDFAMSCNTGFITNAGRLGGSGLVDTAAQFGLTQRWNVGTPASQPSVPGGTGDELTSEMIGQGHLKMSPLIMASVAATARDGDFHQPRIVAASLIAGPVATAPGIPSATAAQLRSMMHSAVRYGTAKNVMAGLGPDTGAKTGSAEMDGATEPNGWFLAYRGHVAAAAVVLAGGHGNSSAGPIVADVLRAS